MTNNQNNQTQKSSPTRLIAYQVTERGKGKAKQSFWTRIGVAFPHQDGKVGLNIQLDALPLDGKIVLLPPREKDEVAS